MIKLMTKRAWPAMLVLLSLCLMTTPSRATVITDPANDFIPTFTGTKSPDLDVLSVFATFDGAAFYSGLHNRTAAMHGEEVWRRASANPKRMMAAVRNRQATETSGGTMPSCSLIANQVDPQMSMVTT